MSRSTGGQSRPEPGEERERRASVVSVSHTWPLEQARSCQPPQQVHYRADVAVGVCQTTAADIVPATPATSAQNRLYCATKDVDLECARSGDSIRATTNICPFSTATQDPRTASSQHFTSTEMNNGRESMIQAASGTSASETGKRRSGGPVDGQAQQTMTNYVSERRHALNNPPAYDNLQHQEYKNGSSTQQRPVVFSTPNGQGHLDQARHRYQSSYRSSVSPVAGKSVRGVVESLIRQAETHLGSNYANTVCNANNNYADEFEQVNWRTRHSTDWNNHPVMETMDEGSSWHRSSRSGDYVELHDACTQTTPVSLSRSSSFTWVSEMDQRPISYSQENMHTLEAREASPTDTSGGSGLDDEDLRSLTPMTDRPGSEANAMPGLDHGSALDKSLSLSGISHSSSSSADMNEYMQNAVAAYEEKMGKEKVAENRGTVMGISGVNSAIQRRNSGRSNEVKKMETCETWPPANSATGEPLLSESLRLLLETVNSGPGEGPNNQASLASVRKADKFDNAPVGVRSLAAGRDLARLLIASSAAAQQHQQNQRAGFTQDMAACKKEGASRIAAQQQHVHVTYEARKCLAVPRSPSENESDFEESIYDNVPRNALTAQASRRGANFVAPSSKASPFLRRNRRPLAATPDSPVDVGEKTVGGNMQRDISVASGLLADSESSPVCAERGFALLDGFRSDLATPDSVKSLGSSDGGGGTTQAAPEFQYKSARDYMMDREAQILATMPSRSSHRCPSETTAVMGFVPKESLLRGETTRFLSPPSPNTATTNSTTTVGGESSSSGGHAGTGENGSKLSLAIPFEARPALANSLPALDRLLDTHSSGLGPRPSAPVPKEMTAFNGSNSVELVADCETAESSGAAFSSRKENAEAEARQCCFWLKAAGFPQYASMYEDGQFPIDIDAVQKDHEFLDSDSLQALFRRLRTLNRCALMQLGAGPFHKRIMPSTAKPEKDSEDEEDEIALSRKWRFVRKSRTWSRIVNEFGCGPGQYQLTPTDGSLSPPQTVSSITPGPSHLMDDNDSESMENSISIGGKTQVLEHRKGPEEPMSPPQFVKLRNASLRQRDESSRVDQQQQQQQQRLRRSQSERLRDKAKALVRRMELMKNGRLRRRSPSLRRNGAEPEISGPVLIQHFSASPAHMRMFKDSCVAAPVPNVLNARQATNANSQLSGVMGKAKISNDERRRGRIFSAELGVPAEDANEVGLAESECRSTEYQGMTAGQLEADTRLRSNSQALVANGASNRQSYQPQPAYDRNGKRQYPESDSSPETQAKSGSSLRVQVDVELRANTMPPVSQSSFDSSDADHSPQCWERRDSGVGSSLSRSPSAPARPRVRWHSFQRRHGPSAAAIRSGDTPASVDHLTAPQVIAVQKYALLKLTALMEKYSPSYKSSGWSWGVQKLLRRMKASETKVDKERQVFGVALWVVAQRTGQPLPQCILHALRYLRKQSVDNVGLFRKSGVRSRIQKLRQLCETSTDLPVFESQQAYDVADMVKQYFRELPEPLLTSKLSETFIAIHLNVPEHLRMEAMQKLVLLLPDENREVLLSLLYFLHDVASHADRNQMTAQNLAVCFAPTLFQMSGRNAAVSPTRRHKTITAASGLPNEKELMENRAAQICLASMIMHCKKLFSVPQDILMKCAHTVADMHEPSNLADLGYPYGNHATYLGGCIEALMKEHRERWRGWVTEGCLDGVEITSKKTNDDYPLKLWRCWVDVEAPPRELLHRILRERDAWDDDIIKWRIVRKLSDNCEVFQFVVNDMPPHPTRDYCVVRQWQSDIHELRGGCVLVQTSVNVPEAPMLGGVRGVCLASRYLIEPSGGGKSRITQVDRIDTRGRSKTWYNKVFGYLIATQLARLRDSFKQNMAEGPETKV